LANMADTAFGRIARGEIPVELLHEDSVCVAFADNAPQAPVHVLVIPRQAFSDILEADDETVGHVMGVAARLGEKLCPGGFRLVTNTGKDGGQSVQHWHVHVLGGRELGWPPG
jgi:histidine triad (HIT) family protein